MPPRQHLVRLRQQGVTKLYTTAGEYKSNLGMVGDGILSMSGIVGELAKLQVVFAATGPRLVRYKGCISGPLTAETSSQAHSGISASDGGSPA